MAPATAIAANTRLTYRHQRHDRYSVSTPPMISPTALPPAATEPKTPKARPRSCGSVNVLTRVPSADGARTAPNAPCSARAVTRTTNVPAAPPIAEAIAKPTRLVINTHLRLKMSPSRPPTSSRLPNDSAYAVTTHCRSPLEKPSACCADGSAMLTIVASSTSISWATAATTRTSQRRSAVAVRRSRVAEVLVTDDKDPYRTFSHGTACIGQTHPTRTPWSRPTDNSCTQPGENPSPHLRDSRQLRWPGTEKAVS